MAIEDADLLVLRQNSSGQIRKATVAALLAKVGPTDTPTLDEVTTEGATTANDISVGKLTSTSAEVNGTIAATGAIGTTASISADTSITAGTSISATENITAGVGDNQIILTSTTGEITGGANVFIDGGEYAS